ncbi:MAG: hypothetical protein IPJ39_00065 [Saprospiraceae bacterium]|nr:hypothetical protein [Saprospiraceae bacterium]
MNRFIIVIIATLCFYNIGISQVGFNFDFDDCTYEDSGLMFQVSHLEATQDANAD